MARFVLCVLCVFAIRANDVAVAAPLATGDLARVNGEAVFAAEVEAEFRLAYGNRKFSDEERQRLMRAALDQVIDRRLVMAYLTKIGEAASKADIDVELA